RSDEFQVPDLAVGFYDWAFAFDHPAGRAWVISTGFPEIALRPRRRRALQRLAEVKQWLAEGYPPTVFPTGAGGHPGGQWPVRGFAGVVSNFNGDTYLAAVRRVIEYIGAGDCFQVNLAQRLLHPATLPPLELYRRLRECNAGTFAGYFDLGEFVVASASPE